MKQRIKYKLGVLGFGRMGSAIATGAIIKDYLERYDICAYDPAEDKQKNIKSEGFALCSSPLEVAKQCRILLLACPRDQLPSILPEIKDAEVPCILSIIKGITSSYFHEYLPDVPVIRALVNTPLKIYEGSTAMSMSSDVHADDYDFCFNLFRSLGKVNTVPENKLDTVQCMHATAPAYICCYAEAMLRKPEEIGFDEDAARALLVQSLIGTARLLQENRTASLEDVLTLLCDNDPPSIEAFETMKKEGFDSKVREIARKTVDLIHKDEK